MAYDMKHVLFSADEVASMEEIAERLKEYFQWESATVSDDGTRVLFKAEDGDDCKVKDGYVGPSGFAYHLEENEADRFEEEDSWDEYDVDWGEIFDWSNYVWGDDEDGNPVAVHS